MNFEIEVKKIYPKAYFEWEFEPYYSDDNGEMVVIIYDGFGNIICDECILDIQEAWESAYKRCQNMTDK